MPQTSHAFTARTVSPSHAPLAPLNLLRAGVPVREVIWFRRLKPDKQMAALATARGALLLDKVRSFAANQGGPPITGQAA